MKKVWIILCFLVLLASCQKDKDVFTIVTTTSLDHSGLLEYLIPDFEEECNCEVHIVALGTGAALEMGKNKQADVLLVHDKTRELEFIEQGYGISRIPIMYNDFIFVGPKEIQASTLFDVLAFLYGKESFYSRGDESGTHAKERSLWSEFGYQVSYELPWYHETGQGMGDTLIMTSINQGYTLTDRGTFLSMKEELDLEIIYENVETLINEYSLITISGNESDLAAMFETWITSDSTKQLIDDYSKYDQQLFYSVRGD